MGREIEIKIPLTDAQYDFIHDVIFGKESVADVTVLGNCEHILKSDEYYSRYNSREESKKAGEPQVIRIRCEEEVESGTARKVGTYEAGVGTGGGNPSSARRAFFCIKRKSIENGIELNREDETFVENVDVIRDILTLSGYHKFFEKKKDAFGVYCKSGVLDGADFHLELEVVNALKYIEVEVTDEGVPADTVRTALEKFIALFGLDAGKRDSRSWMQILGELR